MSYTCPQCGRTAHNPNDAEQRYCGACHIWEDEAKRPTPLRVIIESPLAGDEQRNIEYARRCMRDSLARGEAPYASHLLYTQVLDDCDPHHRSMGMRAGMAWVPAADMTVVYTDFGISKGMRAGIEAAKRHHRPVEYRTLDEPESSLAPANDDDLSPA